MKFSDPKMQTFYEEVKCFCADNLPDDIRRRIELGHTLKPEDHARWQNILKEKGWYGGFWPKEMGGLGWTAYQRFVFDFAVAEAGGGPLLIFGPALVAPVIYSFGSEYQKQKHLPGIRDSKVWWCQGYSEPGAGSDLVAVKTTAVRDGDDYIVNGQKIWTTNAHWADWMFCLVRTSTEGPPHKGISFLLIDMKTPGVTVRPIHTIDQEHHINEVFLENVRVPKVELVGQEGEAWFYAKYLLSHERFNLNNAGRIRRIFRRLKRLALNTYEGGKPLIDDPAFHRKLADLEIRMHALEAVCDQMMARAESGEELGDEVAIFKLRGSELTQAVTELEMEVSARSGLRHELSDFEAALDAPEGFLKGMSGAAREYLFNRAITIAGGSSEVQRNIIAKSMFG